MEAVSKTVIHGHAVSFSVRELCTTHRRTHQNWSGNLVHKPASDGGKYYFAPTNLTELKSVLTDGDC
jgi:hypothetical protein